MALSSMTGFARGHGVSGTYSWAWELKSVNAKGLDLRLRLPPGWDAVEVPARNSAAQVLARGTVYGTLTAGRQGVAPVVRVNEPVLSAVLATINALAGRLDAAKPRLDGILSLKGVIEVIDEDEREEDRRVAEAAVVAGFRATVAELAAMRRHEGEALGQILTQRVKEIAVLAARADAAPGRRPEAIKARIAEQVALLLDSSTRFDADPLDPMLPQPRQQHGVTSRRVLHLQLLAAALDRYIELSFAGIDPGTDRGMLGHLRRSLPCYANLKFVQPSGSR